MGFRLQWYLLRRPAASPLIEQPGISATEYTELTEIKNEISVSSAAVYINLAFVCANQVKHKRRRRNGQGAYLR